MVIIFEWKYTFTAKYNIPQLQYRPQELFPVTGRSLRLEEMLV
jgi:hypothetical protein